MPGATKPSYISAMRESSPRMDDLLRADIARLQPGAADSGWDTAGEPAIDDRMRKLPTLCPLCPTSIAEERPGRHAQGDSALGQAGISSFTFSHGTAKPDAARAPPRSAARSALGWALALHPAICSSLSAAVL